MKKLAGFNGETKDIYIYIMHRTGRVNIRPLPKADRIFPSALSGAIRLFIFLQFRETLRECRNEASAKKLSSDQKALSLFGCVYRCLVNITLCAERGREIHCMDLLSEGFIIGTGSESFHYTNAEHQMIQLTN
jgi:hypothetical protein